MQFFYPVRRYGDTQSRQAFLARLTFLRILLFLNLFQFLLKSSSIHLSRYGQTEREG